MRSTFDRIRQAILFEFTAILLFIPLGHLLFSFTFADIGVVAVVGSTIAMIWNYFYNFGFDLLLRRLKGSVEKSLPARIIHAIGMEFTIMLMLLPFLMWWLSASLFHALAFDLAFSIFFMIYTFLFTWVYDHVFPAPT